MEKVNNSLKPYKGIGMIGQANMCFRWPETFQLSIAFEKTKKNQHNFASI